MSLCRRRTISRAIGVVVLASGLVPQPVARADTGITLADLGVVNSQAGALDDLGQVVGTEFESPQQGWLWEAGVVTPLNGVDQALDINDIGEIVGYRLIDPRGGNPTPVRWDNGVVTDLAGIGVAGAI